MNVYAPLFEQLNDAVDLKTLQQIAASPLFVEHERLQALHALKGQDSSLLNFSTLKSGALPLFGKSLFPWGALPYPEEHALLGALLAQIENERPIAPGMRVYQQATLDHHQQPLQFLFAQEKGSSLQGLQKANADFFEALQVRPERSSQFIDQELGLIAIKTDISTLLCVGSGCKSGSGAFLYHDVGVVNMGPQLSPIGECLAFGIAGRAENLKLMQGEDEFALNFRSRLAANSTRSTGFLHLQDSGYSALWLEAEMRGNATQLHVNGQIIGTGSFEKGLFTIFGKGEVCSVARSHKLIPRSLNRYQGPVQQIHFESTLAKVSLEAPQGAVSMEVIPLAGDASFWGADFLVAYSLSEHAIELIISIEA